MGANLKRVCLCVYTDFQGSLKNAEETEECRMAEICGWEGMFNWKQGFHYRRILGNVCMEVTS